MVAVSKPNVLWIMADELRADALSCYGNPHPAVQTPHLDALAAGGTVFDRCYTSSPVCVPARYALATGQSPLASGVMNNEGFGAVDTDRSEMFTEAFARAGWSTMNFGKEHLPGGRSPWQRDDHTGSGMNELLAVARENGAEIRRSPGIGHVYAATLRAGVETGSELITRSASEAIRTSDGPFFVRASFVQPHKPMIVPEPWASRYAEVDFTAPRSPEGSGNAFEREWGRLTRGEELSDEELQLSFQMYYGCVAWLDDQIGELLRALEESGRRASTIVVVTTDHGASLGEYGIMAKHTFAPESHRVPLIFSAPGSIPEGSRRSDLAVSEDLAATLVGLAGLPPLQQQTARNLFADPAPERIYSAIGYGDESSRAFPNRDAGAWSDGKGWPQRVCVRTHRYRLDLTTRRGGAAVPPEEEDAFLTDSLVDPSERTNLVGDPRYAAVLDELLAAARAAGHAIPAAEIRPDDFDRLRAGFEAN